MQASASASIWIVVALAAFFLLSTTVQAFSTPRNAPGNAGLPVRTTAVVRPLTSTTAATFLGRSSVRLQATSSGGKKKRRRRRKQPPVDAAESSSPPPKTATEMPAAVEAPKETVEKISVEVDIVDTFDGSDADEGVDLAVLKDVASFSFDGAIEGVDGEGTATTPSPPAGISESGEVVQSPESQDGAIPLPDIKDTLRKKEVAAQMARLEEQQEEKQQKIDRNDRQALLKQPYADADASFFEEEEYTTVSALLGERAKPFLGIPTGPLQVGHFIGSLVIVLMAFVQYPGFPLTNLPTPLRGALQGGLGVVYAINIVLAVMAAFKAGERGQPAPLWIAKTFSVGGLAYDQLTQLPTLEEVKQAEARKGKRALKKNKAKKY
ncbi:MAG: hypothetical protein SGILL_002090 [Bacillariaceae sp.]